VGVTDKQQYIHRVGRTARAGKSGVGVLLVCDFEAEFQLNHLQGLPIEKDALQRASAASVETVADVVRNVDGDAALNKAAQQAYQVRACQFYLVHVVSFYVAVLLFFVITFNVFFYHTRRGSAFRLSVQTCIIHITYIFHNLEGN
jgi:hypothetical protein